MAAPSRAYSLTEPVDVTEETFNAPMRYEFVDSKELAARWCLPESWIREQVRSRSTDPIPNVRSANMSVSAGAVRNWKIGPNGV